MATRVFVGDAIANNKVITISGDSLAYSLSRIDIGLGNKLLSVTGWNTSEIAGLWGGQVDKDFKEISCVASGASLVFTCNTKGKDFEISMFVDGVSIYSDLSSNCVQMLSFNKATGGTFTITHGTETTGSITYVANDPATTASNIQTALIALSAFASGDVVVTPLTTNTKFVVQFQSVWAGQKVDLLTIDYSSLLGGDAAIKIEGVSNYHAATAEVQTITFSVSQTVTPQDEVQRITIVGNPTSGAFKLTFDGQQTSGINVPATTSGVESALVALSNVASGDVVCTGGPLPSNPIDVKFTGAYAVTNVPQMTGDVHTLSGNSTNLAVSTTQNGVAPSATLKLGFKTTTSISSPVNCGFSLGGLVTLSFSSDETLANIKAKLASMFYSIDGPFLGAFSSKTGGIAFHSSELTLGGAIGNSGDGLTVEFAPSAAVKWDINSNSFIFNGDSFPLSLVVTGYTCNTTILAEPDGTTAKLEIQKLKPIGTVPTTGSFNLDYGGTNTASLTLSPYAPIYPVTIAKLINDAIPNTNAPVTSIYMVRSYVGGVRTKEVQLTFPVSSSDLATFFDFGLSSLTVLIPLDVSAGSFVTYPCTGGSTDLAAAATALNAAVATYQASLQNVVTCTGDATPIIPGTSSGEITITFTGGSYVWANDTQLVVEAGAVSPTITISTLIAGGSTSITGVTGGTYTLRIANKLITDIPYNVSASSLEALINGVLGASTVTCSGGPHPNSAITITWNTTGPQDPVVVSPMFTGSLPGLIDVQQLSIGGPPTNRDNSYELVICPGVNTLAVDSSARFDIIVTTPQGRFVVSVPFAKLTPELLEAAINELFAEEVVSVCQSSHTLLHNTFESNPYNTGVVALKFWYYRDIYRLTFVNSLASKSSILSVVAANLSPSLPLVDSTSSSDVSDLTYESHRTYLGFQAKPTLVEAVITKLGTVTPNELSFGYMLETQFKLSSATNVSYRGIGSELADSKIQFMWAGTNPSLGDSGSDAFSETYTEIFSSELIPWDTPPEVIQSVLEKSFGVGNVLVTGSLPIQLNVTLQGQLSQIPFNLYRYKLILKFITSDGVTWFDPVAKPYDPANPLVRPYSFCSSKPLPPFLNTRYRVDCKDASSIKVSFNRSSVTIYPTDTTAAITTKLNSITSLPITPLCSPEKYFQPIQVYGSMATKVFTIEFIGLGYNTKPHILQIQGSASIVSVSTDTDGSNLVKEVHRLSMSPVATGGTFKLSVGAYQTSALAYNVSASSLKTALEALTSVGSGKVVCTGGPFPLIPITLTYDTTLGDIGLTTWTYDNLANSTITNEYIRTGGATGIFSVVETVKGTGPLYFDVPENWVNRTLPSTGDTIVIDQCPTDITQGLRQKYSFIAFDKEIDPVTGSITYKRLLLNPRRPAFQEGQLVTISTTGTLPSGLTAGDYYIRSPKSDGSFELSTTAGGDSIKPSTIGSGTHSVFLSNLTLNHYARSNCTSIGLPAIRSSGNSEFLCQYLTAGFTAIHLGIDDGAGLVLGRFDTLTAATAITVDQSDSSDITSVPAILFNVNNVDATLTVNDASVGLSLFPGQSSSLKSITVNGSGSEIFISNTVVADTTTFKGKPTVQIRNSDLGDVIRL